MGHRYVCADDTEGLRYIRNILIDARKAAKEASASGKFAAARRYAVREVAVIDRVLRRYFSSHGEIQDFPSEIDDVIELSGQKRATIKKQLVEARLGQGRFRSDLDVRWGYACAVTKCNLREVLRASHMKPWSKSNQHERLDPNNGLLLQANIDALFDRYLISFADDGTMLLSNRLSTQHRKSLGLSNGRLRQPLSAPELRYLRHHRKEFDRRNEE